ncbi:hypothetical protein K456DRAFT_42890 [Colletotrichum gloeosporioides 23]|nr:hypothetical protein K456DRAFT_42890 [Colletotrichum gloeosporioides 23]
MHQAAVEEGQQRAGGGRRGTSWNVSGRWWRRGTGKEGRIWRRREFLEEARRVRGMAQGSAGSIRRLAFGQTILERAAKKESSLRSEGIAKPAKTGLWVDERNSVEEGRKRLTAQLGRSCKRNRNQQQGSYKTRTQEARDIMPAVARGPGIAGYRLAGSGSQLKQPQHAALRWPGRSRIRRMRRNGVPGWVLAQRSKSPSVTPFTPSVFGGGQLAHRLLAELLQTWLPPKKNGKKTSEHGPRAGMPSSKSLRGQPGLRLLLWVWTCCRRMRGHACLTLSSEQVRMHQTESFFFFFFFFFLCSEPEQSACGGQDVGRFSAAMGPTRGQKHQKRATQSAARQPTGCVGRRSSLGFLACQVMIPFLGFNAVGPAWTATTVHSSLTHAHTSYG